MPKCVVLFSRAPPECASPYHRWPGWNYSFCHRTGRVTAGSAPPSHPPTPTRLPRHRPFNPNWLPSLQYFLLHKKVYLMLLAGVHMHLVELPDRPRIITVTCEPPHAPAQGACPTPLVQGYFPGGQADSVVLTQGLNGEPLRFPLHLWYSPGALAANAPVNRAIFRITSGAASKPWCGPVIVLKFNGSRRQGYSDAGSNDLPALSAYFLAYK